MEFSHRRWKSECDWSETIELGHRTRVIIVIFC